MATASLNVAHMPHPITSLVCPILPRVYKIRRGGHWALSISTSLSSFFLSFVLTSVYTLIVGAEVILSTGHPVVFKYNIKMK
jgi:hypothetical protein